MDFLFKMVRVFFYALLISLLLGIENVRDKPLLWGFLLILFAARIHEVFNPAARMLNDWRHNKEYPRWFNWLISLSFLTNLIIPILDFRYRPDRDLSSYAAWTSPFPQEPWWAWIGLLVLAGGTALRIKTIRQLGETVSKTRMGRTNKKKRGRKIETKEPTLEPTLQQWQSIQYGTLLSYLGIAITFASLWGLIGVLVVVLPVVLFQVKQEEKVADEHASVS